MNQEYKRFQELAGIINESYEGTTHSSSGLYMVIIINQ